MQFPAAASAFTQAEPRIQCRGDANPTWLTVSRGSAVVATDSGRKVSTVSTMSRAKAALRKTPFFPAIKHTQERFSPPRRQDRMRRLAMYRQFVKPGDLAFDVGANMGNRTDPLLELGAYVVAVEPQPACIATLNKRFGHIPRFALAPVGVGEVAGSATLHIATNHVTSSMSHDFMSVMEFRDSGWKEQIDVRVTTLDALIQVFGTPVFCKIDIEGFEVPALQGLHTPLAALSLEYTPDMSNASASALQIVSELGQYEFAYSPGESMRFSSHGWMTAQAAIEMAAAAELPFGDFYARLR